MKIYLYLIAVFVLFASFVSAEEGALLHVKSTKLYDTSWTNPSDGSTPTLTAWKLKVTLDDDYVFETYHTIIPDQTNPKALVKPHDTLQIIQEAYHDTNPTFSWFRVLNTTTGQELELTGLARQPKPTTEPNTPAVLGLQKKQISDNKWLLTFFINNLKSLLETEMTEIYTTFEVDSERYHGYYEGMPLTFIEEHPDDIDAFGRNRKSLVFFNPILNAEVTFKSKWMGGIDHCLVENVLVDKKVIRTRFGSEGGNIVVGDWTVQINLNDGGLFIFQGSAPKHGTEKSANGKLIFVVPSEIDNMFWVGDTIELIEDPAPNPIQSQYRTQYQIKNLRSGNIYQSSGEIRYLNGYPSSS